MRSSYELIGTWFAKKKVGFYSSTGHGIRVMGAGASWAISCGLHCAI